MGCRFSVFFCDIDLETRVSGGESKSLYCIVLRCLSRTPNKLQAPSCSRVRTVYVSVVFAAMRRPRPVACPRRWNVIVGLDLIGFALVELAFVAFAFAFCLCCMFAFEIFSVSSGCREGSGAPWAGGATRAMVAHVLSPFSCFSCFLFCVLCLSVLRVGEDAVSWLQSECGPRSVEEALSIGNRMIAAGLIYHCTYGHSLENSRLFYK